MNPNEVLNRFINLVNANLNDLEYHLASNAVLEVFGRTIKTSKKISDHFRYSFCEQYEHNFSTAESIPAFESRDSHNITKDNPPENFIDSPTTEYIQPTLSSYKPTDNYRTPPKVQKSPKLPELAQGRKFLTEDSDDSEGSVCDNASLDMSGIYRLDATNNKETTQVAGIKRSEPNGNREDIDEDEPQEKISKPDISDLNEVIPVEKNVDSIESNNLDVKQNDGDIEVVEQNQYSDLEYIQSNGVLNQLRRIKHRGVTTLNVSSSSFDETPQSSSSTVLASDPWDRPAYLKLSYRTRTNDNHIQFALIIYEAITRNPRSRRNLANEFTMVVPKSSVRKKTMNLSTEKETPSKSGGDNKPLPSIKKSLRF